MRSLSSERDRQTLIDIQENACLARDFTNGLSYAAFASDRRTFYAVTRCLEIISEASRRLNDEVRARHSHLPWRAILGAGNVYRHDYDVVIESLVWRTVNEDLPTIILFAETELSRF
jgi:uncharacterized protein with HEPN domain